MDRAIRDGKIDVVRDLITADPTLIHKPSSRTPLLASVVAGNMELIRMLIAAGSSVTVQNASGNTVLHIAAQRGRTEILEYFLSRDDTKELLNIENNIDRTALGLAAREGHRSAVELLINYGASIRPDDIEITRERGHTALADYLTQKFARQIRWLETPPSAPTTDPGVFLLAGGHGGELIGKRDIVPEGRTLVAMAKCGSMLVNADIFHKLAMMFTSPDAAEIKEILLDVRTRAEEIEEFLDIPRGTLRIYRAGDSCPRLMFMPVGIQRLPGIIAYSNSGVYQLPTLREQLFSSKDSLEMIVLGEDEPIDSGLLDGMYGGSVYPTPAAAKEILRLTDSVSEFESLLTTPVSEIMNHLGAGVYFYAVCRSTLTPLDVENFVLREYNKDPETVRPLLIDVPGKFAEIVNRFNPPLAANTAGRIANIMAHRARSSSERRRVRRSSGGYRRVTLKRSTR